jgi:hypothetical protein
MALKLISALKGFFNTGDKPTEQNFADLIDSTIERAAVVTVTGTAGIQAALQAIDTATTEVRYVILRISPASNQAADQFIIYAYDNNQNTNYNSIYRVDAGNGTGSWVAIAGNYMNHPIAFERNQFPGYGWSYGMIEGPIAQTAKKTIGKVPAGAAILQSLVFVETGITYSGVEPQVQAGIATDNVEAIFAPDTVSTLGLTTTGWKSGAPDDRVISISNPRSTGERDLFFENLNGFGDIDNCKLHFYTAYLIVPV